MRLVAVLCLAMAFPLAAASKPPPEPAPAAPASQTAAARTRAALDTLLAACASDDLTTAATRIVYRGDDAARRWKSPVNPEAADELKEVRAICTRAVALDPERTGVVEAEYDSRTQSEGTWHALSVTFGGSGKAAVFAFLDIDGTLLLGDID